MVDDNIITGEGVGAAIDMSLKIIEIFSSKEKSDEIKEKRSYYFKKKTMVKDFIDL